MSDEFFTKEDADLVRKENLFPEGTYPVTITGCSIKSENDKKWVALELTVIGGEHEGRKKWVNLYKNHGHPNEKLWKWHLQILSSLDAALGVEKMTPDHVLGQSCAMQIEHSKRNDTVYDNVKRFLAIQS